MSRKISLISFLLLVVMQAGAFDHSGGGSSVAAPHGGSMVVSDEISTNVEVRFDRSAVKIYFYAKDMKPLDSNSFNLSAEINSSGKNLPVVLVDKGGFAVVRIKKNIKKFDLYLNVKNKSSGSHTFNNFPVFASHVRDFRQDGFGGEIWAGIF